MSVVYTLHCELERKRAGLLKFSLQMKFPDCPLHENLSPGHIIHFCGGLIDRVYRETGFEYFTLGLILMFSLFSVSVVLLFYCLMFFFCLFVFPVTAHTTHKQMFNTLQV